MRFLILALALCVGLSAACTRPPDTPQPSAQPTVDLPPVSLSSSATIDSTCNDGVGHLFVFVPPLSWSHHSAELASPAAAHNDAADVGSGLVLPVRDALPAPPLLAHQALAPPDAATPRFSRPPATQRC